MIASALAAESLSESLSANLTLAAVTAGNRVTTGSCQRPTCLNPVSHQACETSLFFAKSVLSRLLAHRLLLTTKHTQEDR